MIVFVKKVSKLMITQFGYIHPLKSLYLPDTLHHIISVLVKIMSYCLMFNISRYLRKKRRYFFLVLNVISKASFLCASLHGLPHAAKPIDNLKLYSH